MKKIIRLTESELARIVNRVIKESVGVPENIVEVSEQIWDKVRSTLFYKLEDNQKRFTIKLNTPYKLSNQLIYETLIEVRIEYWNEDKFNMNASANKANITDGGYQKPGNLHFPVYDYGKLKLSIVLYIPKEYESDIDKTKSLIDEKQSVLLSNISHEIKHNYDFEKLKNLPLDKFSTYKTSVTMYKDMVGPIKSMFYKLYYLNNIENLVRPTELYAKLKSEGITKNEFLNFFKKEYRILFDSEKFKLKDLIKELKSDIGHIESILGKFVDMKNMSDDEKIKEYLTATYRLYVREAEMLYKTKIIGHSFFNTKDVIKNTEIEGIHKKSYDNFMKDLKKYLSEPIKFYNNVEKEINSSATKMIKKLSKVYSLLPE